MQKVSEIISHALKHADGALPSDALAAMHDRLTFLRHLHQGLAEMLLCISQAACRRARTHFVAAQSALASMKISGGCAATEEPTSFVPSLHLSAWALPPPPAQPLTRDAAYSILASTLTSLESACAITDVSTLPDLKAFLERFLDGRVNAIARAALHMQLSTRSALSDLDIPDWAPSMRMLMRDICLSPSISNQV